MGVASADENSKALTATDIRIKSSLDGTEQPALFYVPPSATPDAAGRSVPLLVSLHTWSSDYNRYDSFQVALLECNRRGWVFLSPSFRGPNNRPEACASDLAVGDILDAVAFAKTHARVDQNRIYLLGGSGGGHMSLVMAHRAPQVWAGVSAWVPISDLFAWHAFCKKAGYRYAQMMESCCGGPPGSPGTDEQYRKRSPLFHLAAAKGVAIDIQSGIRDGHGGASVPIDHSLNAFNALAGINGHSDKKIAHLDIAAMTRHARVPPHLADKPPTEPGRKHAILFRRSAGPARITLFDGGHEIDPAPAIQWLATKGKASGK